GRSTSAAASWCARSGWRGSASWRAGEPPGSTTRWRGSPSAARRWGVGSERGWGFPPRRAGGGGGWGGCTRNLAMVQEEACGCKEITQRLLEFSRGGERKREQTDLGELIQSVLEVVQHLQNCRGKEVTFKPTYRVVAWVNAQEIKSVVLNLIVNALDSMDEGGKVAISLGRRDGNAELVFKDTGCGMTAEVLENIFEP